LLLPQLKRECNALFWQFFMSLVRTKSFGWK
jgi:hypothetical protein